MTILGPEFRYRHRISKAKAVDGDGDGWVHDATPKKRPATPAEMEAGRKLRQAAKKAGGAAKKAGAPARGGGNKRAPAKNEYDKRYDKFDRAINQAIRANDPKEVKRVRDLIRQDIGLNAKDRKDLEAVLNARRDGLPDPAPVKGGNREKRGVKGGAAAPAKKAPAKKAAAAKPPAKKAAAKKPAPARQPTIAPATSPEVGRGRPAGDRAARLKAKEEQNAKDFPKGEKVELTVHGLNGRQDRVEGTVVGHKRGHVIVRAGDGHGELAAEPEKLRIKKPKKAQKKAVQPKEKPEKHGLPDPKAPPKKMVDQARANRAARRDKEEREDPVGRLERMIQAAKGPRGLNEAEKRVMDMQGEGRIGVQERNSLLRQVREKREGLNKPKKKPGAIREAAGKTPELDLDRDKRFDQPNPERRYQEKIDAAKDLNALRRIARELLRDQQVAGGNKKAINDAMKRKQQELIDAAKPKAERELRNREAQDAKGEVIDRLRQQIAHADNPDAINAVKEAIDNAPELDDKARKELHQDRRAQARDNMRPGRKTEPPKAPPKGGRSAVYRNFDQEIDTQMPKAADKTRLEGVFRRQIDADPDMDAAEKAALKYKLDRMKSARAKTQAPPKPPASVPVQPRDTHGNKTKNWMRLVQRDIRNAKQAGDLDAAERQINSLERRGRITPAEAVALRAKVSRARQKKFGDDKGGLGQRVRSLMGRPSRQPRAGKDQAKVEADRLIAQIDGANSEDDLHRIKNGIGAPTKALMRDNRTHMQRINDAFKARAQAIRNGGQAQPERPSVVARRGVMERFDGLERMARDNPSQLEGAIEGELNRIVADKDLTPSEKEFFIGKLENLWNDQQADPSVLKPAPTLQPRKPPGAARARAREQMGTQAEEYLNRVNGAQSAGDLNAIVDEFNNQQDLSMTPEEVDAVFDELERKMYRVAPIDEWRANIIDRPPRDIDVPKYDGDPAQSPAGRHLAAGGEIEGIPDPTGLRDYIQANPTRFDLKIDTSGQASEVWFVRDKQNGKDYFFKTTNNNGDADMFGDGVNEYMAAALGNAAFADMFPQVEFAGRPEGGVNAAIRMDHINEFAKRFTGVRGVSTKGHRAKGSEIKDPRNPLAIHIFDYLINQTDRHQDNFGVVNTDKGQIIIPLDNGAGFHGYDAYVAHPMGLQFFGIPERIGLALRDEPENVSYNDWAGLRKPQIIARLTKDAYREKNWGRSKLKQDAEEILEQFRKADIDQIIEDLRDRFPNLNGYEDGHLEGARVIWKQRLANLSTDDIVRMLG